MRVVAHLHRTYTEGIKSAEIPGGGIALWFEIVRSLQSCTISKWTAATCFASP